MIKHKMALACLQIATAVVEPYNTVYLDRTRLTSLTSNATSPIVVPCVRCALRPPLFPLPRTLQNALLQHEVVPRPAFW